MYVECIYLVIQNAVIVELMGGTGLSYSVFTIEYTYGVALILPTAC